jgi:hypothetical protein
MKTTISIASGIAAGIVTMANLYKYIGSGNVDESGAVFFIVISFVAGFGAADFTDSLLEYLRPSK